MSGNSRIEWTDATWNPVVGCEHVSPGCDNCYAARDASARLRNVPQYVGLAENGRFNGTVRLLPERLEQPLRWRRPRRVFVNSMADLFHKDIPDHFIARVFGVMASSAAHTFQVLTKRHARMKALMSSGDFVEAAREHWADLLSVGPSRVQQEWSWPLPNVWLGVSVESQQWANLRIPALRNTPAAVRFLSCEPLLDELDLSGHLQCFRCKTAHKFGSCDPSAKPTPYGPLAPSHIDWVIVGGESGHDARPMHPDWPRVIRDQCLAAGVAFHFKQWGEWRAATSRDVADGFGKCQVRTLRAPRRGEARSVIRVGRTAAGRVLGGRTWDEFPAVTR